MNEKEIKEKVQSQFGRVAAEYVTSKVHAQGPSLQRMVELTNPQPDWQALDIATGGGHAAFAFAPHVGHIVATDITDEMLQVAAAEADKRGLTNISYEYAEAGNLPFERDRFDLVVCRVAAHHFPDQFKFMQEAFRVLKPGGTFTIVDNTVPDGVGGDYMNAFEKLRDPGHVLCVSPNQWEEDLYAAGFDLLHSESSAMPLDFDAWTARMRVSDVNTTRLKAMLKQAPEEAGAVLTPIFQGDRITFHLQKTILIAKART